MKHLLIIEDDKVDQMAFERFAKTPEFSFTYELVGSITDAKKALKNNRYNAIVSDFFLGDGNTFEILDLKVDIPLIVTTGTGSEEIAVNALKKGAYDYLIKDVDGYYLKMLPITIKNTLQRFQSEKDLKNYQLNLEEKVEARTSELKKKHFELIHLTDELSDKNKMLIESKNRFRNIFELSPVSLWEQDFSEVKKLLNKKSKEVNDLKNYLDENIDFVKLCVSKIKIVDVNTVTLNLLGVKNKNELINHLRNTNNKKSYEVLKRELLSYHSGKKEFIDEAEFIKTDGKTIKTIIKSATIGKKGKVIVSIIDITELKKAKNKLNRAKNKIEKSEKKFRELYEKSGDAILIIKNGIFVDCNESTVKMLNYNSKNEFLNTHPSKLSPKSQPDGQLSVIKADQMMALSVKNGTHRFEWMHIKSNGEIFPVEVLLTSISNEPNNKVIHCVWRDITKRKNVEHELIKAKEKAEESDHLKTEFLNNMSHEIRTPMNGILGFSKFLNNPEIDESKRKSFVNIIQNSGKQLLSIIDDILEISSLETNQVKLVKEEVCLNDLLFELFSIFDLKAKENETPLYLEKGLSDKQSTILIDRSKLSKIISNLLENSLKFTVKGTISFGYYLKGKELEIFVKDTGIGIKKENQKMIFERFSQAEKDLSKKVGGLGLGLSIAKENVQLLGGRISVESELNVGSKFIVHLPYNPVYPLAEIIDSKNENKNKYTILIAEDEEVNFMYLEILILEKLKIPSKIIHAKNGKEAVDICKNIKDIDLVLMDIKMPIMNGFQATQEIKKILPTLPIIAQTAYSTTEDKEMAQKVGIVDFLTKPINKELLHRVLKSYLK